MRVLNLALLLVAAALGPAALAGQSEPARDSRGYPVTSNPLPPGLVAPVRGPDGQVVGTQNVPQDLTPRPSAGDYPPCTREVTDGCIQTHERRRRPK